MKRRRWVLAVFAGLFLASTALLWFWAVGRILTTEGAARLIRKGMTEGEVIAILGPPSKDVWIPLGHSFTHYSHYWNQSDGVLTVDFFDDDRRVDDVSLEIKGYITQSFDRLYYKLFWRVVDNPQLETE